MRIVFFGTPELAVPSLASLAARHEVAAVVCQPDRPQGRSGTPVPPPTKVWAREQGIVVAQPTALNDGAFEAWLKDQAPDLCALAAYGRMLRQPILDVPRHGFLNMHPSLLPRHRGPSPIQTAILSGDDTTGVTIIRLDAGMDTGDIVLQEETPIAPDDTTASLSDRLARTGAALFVEAVGRIETGNATFTPQDPARATVTRRYDKQDGQIRWNAPARAIHNLVRAAVPWPVAHCRLKGAVYRIHQTALVEGPPYNLKVELLTCEAPPGSVVAVERGHVVVATGDGLMALLQIQMPGKRAMSTAEFLRGNAIVPGDRFEEVL